MRTVLLLALVLIPRAVQEPRLPAQTWQPFWVTAAPKSDAGVSGTITGEMIRETPHFQIYVEKSFVPVDLDWLQVEVESIYGYLVERMGVSTTERFALTFRPPDTAPCPMRGLAHSHEPVGQAIVFANEQISRSQLSGVLAHEFAHLLHSRALLAGDWDMNLSEGLASWAAGKYWQAWQGTPANNVRAFRVEGRYKPLEEYYRETPPDTDSASCWKNRDRRYNSWAAFIDFLITEYGMDKFRQLLGPPEGGPSGLSVTESGFIDGYERMRNVLIERELSRALADPPAPGVDFPVVPAPPPMSDFKAVYGLTLSELEKTWLEKFDKGTPLNSYPGPK